MPNDLSRLFAEVSDLKRRIAGGQHEGVVHEVRGDKIRAEWGKDRDGKPVLSPWLNTSDHRGGARERRFYRKGQNVTIATVNAEMNEAATISADAPNDNYKAPITPATRARRPRPISSANCAKRRKDGLWETFLGKGGKTKLRVNDKGGISGAVGDARFVAHEKGAKLKFGDKPDSPFIIVTKDGIFASMPIQLLTKDPIPDDK